MEEMHRIKYVGRGTLGVPFFSDLHLSINLESL